MKNTKMKYKIFFLMMLLLISLNNVSAGTYENGTLEMYVTGETTVELVDEYNYMNFGETTSIMSFKVTDTGKVGSPNKFVFTDVSCQGKGDWEDIPNSVGGVIYIGTNGEYGIGSFYIMKSGTSGKGDIHVYFDENYNAPVGTHELKIYSNILYNYYSGVSRTYGNQYYIDEQTDAFGCCIYLGTSVFGNKTGYPGDVIYYNQGLFSNDYSIYMDYSYGNFSITRVGTSALLHTSSVIIKDINNTEIINTGYASADTNYVYPNETAYYYIKPQTNAIEYLIYDNIPEPPPESVTPTLITDKSLYNTSELLTISYTNIDEMNIHGTPTLFIVYPIIDDYHDYDAKFMQHLLSSKEDETFTINTSILQPENEYYLIIADNTDWSRIVSSYITSDVFYVYSDDEYLTSSCTVEGNCYTGNGDYISIYYKINNNSNIIIKDNNNDVIQIYSNIINEGEINFNIPFDENKLNSYPNWKIYLNNTEYSTSYNTDVTVYWSLFVTPTPTPIYTSVPIDENVSEMVDDLKKESKPIFDLIYGLTTLVIDNPDYDNDNIIDEHEINNWFNSLIPLGILLLLVILYMGLKKRD